MATNTKKVLEDDFTKAEQAKTAEDAKAWADERAKWEADLARKDKEAELLKGGKHTVAEIADMTGFSTQSHFSVVFKKQFGVTPSEFKG